MKKRFVQMISIVLLAVMMAGLSACKPDTDIIPDNIKPEQASESKAAEQPVKPKRIYFAGPLFTEAEREYNQKIVGILESYGYEVFLPQRDGYLAADLEGKSEKEKSEMIFRRDRDEIQKADILFIVLDGRVPDEGACVELGIAYASGKTCYGIKNDTRSLETDLDINPMITGCLSRLFDDQDADSLIRSLKKYLDENQL